MSETKHLLDQLFRDAEETVRSCQDHTPTIIDIADALIESFEKGGRVLICGNGGSCADASHFATELSVRFEKERRGLPALCLGSSAPELTAMGNDFSFEEAFGRLVSAHGRVGDCLIGISTSGNSGNVLGALRVAKDLGLFTIALLGKGGGAANGLAAIELVAPGNSTARVQEAQQVIIHAICSLIDEHFAESDA